MPVSEEPECKKRQVVIWEREWEEKGRQENLEIKQKKIGFCADSIPNTKLPKQLLGSRHQVSENDYFRTLQALVQGCV